MALSEQTLLEMEAGRNRLACIKAEITIAEASTMIRERYGATVRITKLFDYKTNKFGGVLVVRGVEIPFDAEFDAFPNDFIRAQLALVTGK